MAGYTARLWLGMPGAATRAERLPCRYRAYIPDPLVSRPLMISAARAADVADVERQVADLNLAQPRAVSLEALARMLLRAEAVASSFIEGLQINVRRLAKADLADRSGLASRDDTANAVLGNVRAMELAIRIANPGNPVRVRDVLDVHRRLLSGTREARFGGVIRAEQNWVGGTGMTPCTAEYVPPPAELVPELLEDLCRYLSGDDHPAMIQAALAHAQFETVHPFADGNGRTGRALIHIVLQRRGLAPRFVPPISLVLASHADAYIAALTGYRYQGDASSADAQEAMGACVDRFVADTARACADTCHFANDLATLEESWRARLGRVRAGSSVDLLLRALPATPVITVATAAELIGRSSQRAGDAVNKLVAVGVLRQTTIGQRNRAFEAAELVAALTGFERALASPVGDTRMAPPGRPVPYRP